MSDDLLKRLETGHDKECAMSYGMHAHCCDCSYTVRQEAAARVKELEDYIERKRVESSVEMFAYLVRAERAEAERDSVQHLFAQQERHRDELLAERDALRAEVERLRRQRGQAIARIKDMLMGDDGQAWKEARKFLDSIDAALAGEKP